MRAPRSLTRSHGSRASTTAHWRTWIPPEIFTLPRLGTLNVHDSLLPEYAGFSPLIWALINGERSAGITIHALGPGLDAGNILYQELIAIGASEDVASLYDRLNSIQRAVLAATLQRYLDGSEGVPQ